MQRLAALGLMGPLPASMPGAEGDTPELIALGDKLFDEKAISAQRNQACADCHILDNDGAGVDDTPLSEGSQGEFGRRNAPTVLNAGYQFAQFWDGRAMNLEEQSKVPVLDPVEMAMKDGAEVEARLREAGYEAEFKAVFPDDPESLTFDNFAKAMAAYERTFITHDRFDDYLNGDDAALSDLEKQGLQNFMDLNCTQCHIGPGIGGMEYKQAGLYHPYPYQSDPPDFGRFDVTQNEGDKFFFKVPQLRNVAITAPYFHNGKVAALEEAVQLMAFMQLDRQLEPNDLRSLLAFLTALTDKERVQHIPTDLLP